jgi:hypothetical protein
VSGIPHLGLENIARRYNEAEGLDSAATLYNDVGELLEIVEQLRAERDEARAELAEAQKRIGKLAERVSDDEYAKIDWS